MPGRKCFSHSRRALLVVCLGSCVSLMLLVLEFPAPFTRPSAMVDYQVFRQQSTKMENEILHALRNQTVRMICKNNPMHQNIYKLPQNERKVLNHQIIVNDKYKFMYCAVPKVACSNWKRVIRVLNGQWDNMDRERKMDHRKGFKFLSNYSNEEINYRLKHYYKFMFVRNPISRLLSAYRDKFAKPETAFVERYGLKIMQKYRPQWRNTGNMSDIRITFGEFVKFLIDTPTGSMDQHWRPMFEICQPCAVNYSFIGSFENMHSDARIVFHDLGVQDIVDFPSRQDNYYNSTTSLVIQDEIAKIPEEDLRQLISKYTLDFATFAYSAPSIS